jgi:hypothetical protein
MVTLTMQYFKSFDNNNPEIILSLIKKYEHFILKIVLSNFYCPHTDCNAVGQMVKHAYYERGIILNGDETIIITILRIKCKACNRTHALLPPFIVPYSQLLLNDHLEILLAYLLNQDEKINEIQNQLGLTITQITNILNYYHEHWKERVTLESIKTFDLKQIINILDEFKVFFMQSLPTLNVAFTTST